MVSFFSPDITISSQYPSKNIQGSDCTSTLQKNNSIIVQSNGNDPYIIFSNLPDNALSFQLWWTIIFASILVYLIVPKIHITQCLFWQDTFEKKSSSGENIGSLDGLRGFATLGVFCLHSGVAPYTNSGVIGVMIFFILSGFLLALPFTQDCTRIFSFYMMMSFFTRRMKRIFPMFFAYVLIAYFFTERLGDLIRTLLFQEGNFILWTVIEEVHFYMFFPFIMMACCLLSRLFPFGKYYISSLFFFIIAILTQQDIISVPRFYGYEGIMPLMIWLFCSGMMTAFLHKSSIVKNKNIQAILNKDVTGIFLLSSLFCSNFYWWIINREIFFKQNGAIYSSSYYLFICFFILYLVNSQKNSWVNKIFTAPPLRLIGTLSYSFYLLHPTCLHITQSFVQDMENVFIHSDIIHVFFSFILTIILSIITYTFIERPFIKGYGTFHKL